MVVVEYEAGFHELSRHATMILPTKYEGIQFFVRGLGLPLCMATQSVVASGKSFMDSFNYAQTIDEIHQGPRR